MVIPPELPAILKQFTKDAIRTQPEDLLEWSTVYFSALVQGRPLPVRKMPMRVYTTDLTPEALTAMHSQLSKKSTVSKQEVRSAWKRLGLSDNLLKHIYKVGCFGAELDWIKFFALCCSYLGGTIKVAMAHACYIMNCDPTCKPPDACVPFETFRYLYTYLAAVDGDVPQWQMDRALTYLETQAKVCNGVVRVSDFINSRKVRLE
ncbi:ropporin-1-like protein [Colossoma macropomum]|uniref:ropporin-1-like protein n=1 Tax=Colossoma macropomum TaxID=42526 RepID=UPI001865449E|nr:ropporin-1-like protein [Colossoma macropomum]